MSTAVTPSPLLWTLRSIARIERRGDLRPPRLTEPGLIRWNRMKRKLGFVDFIALLHEDLADAFPFPFDLARWGTRPLDMLDEHTAWSLIEAAVAEDNSAPQAFVRTAALALGLPPGGNIAALPKVQPHQSALELPGAAGRIAMQQALDHAVAIHDRFTFVADTEAERVVLGLAMVEVRSNAPRVWSAQEALEQLGRGARFEQVLGVPGHPPAESFATEAGLEVRWS